MGSSRRKRARPCGDDDEFITGFRTLPVHDSRPAVGFRNIFETHLRRQIEAQVLYAGMNAERAKTFKAFVRQTRDATKDSNPDIKATTTFGKNNQRAALAFEYAATLRHPGKCFELDRSRSIKLKRRLNSFIDRDVSGESKLKRIKALRSVPRRKTFKHLPIIYESS